MVRDQQVKAEVESPALDLDQEVLHDFRFSRIFVQVDAFISE